MFSDRYGLTEAVLSEWKTMTRRIVPNSIPIGNWKETATKAYYKVGDFVAIAQSYKNAGVSFLPEEDEEFGCHIFPAAQTSGWTNKMFVRADLMPHQIYIKDVRLQRLQCISEDDCHKEGIYAEYEDEYPITPYSFIYTFPNAPQHYSSPREAYAALIDCISGKGTWDSNPFVFVYEFELVK